MASKDESPGSPKGAEALGPQALETMRRVLKSELEVQNGLLRQQINEDVGLHFAEQSVEAISRKAQDLLEASITLESSLRDHKDLLTHLVGLGEAKAAGSGEKNGVKKPPSLPGAIQQREPPQPGTWEDEIQACQSGIANKTLSDGEDMNSVVPSTPKRSRSPALSSGEEGSSKRKSGRKINVRATVGEFLHVEDVASEESAVKLQDPSLQGRARWLLAQNWFDMVIGSFIILNSVTIGIQADWNVQHIGGEEPDFFMVSEKIFAVIFTGELALRIFGLGFKRFYCGPDWRWALFDTMIVSLQIFDELTTLVVGTAQNGGNLGFMRVMRILRLLRIMRLVRILQFVNELRTMVMSVANSMRSLVWTLLLMLLMKYIIGVYLCQIVADTGIENSANLTPDLVEYYGSLPRAVLSLYQAMTGGVDWNDLSKPLETISPVMQLVFALYIAFAVLAMMNVVTGVFVESALGSAREDREREVVHAVRKIFKMGDQDQSGEISWAEFLKTLEDPSNTRYFSDIGINVAEAQSLFELLDADCSGSISVQEFIQGCLRLRGQAKAIDLATLIYMNKRLVFWLEDRLESVEHCLDHLAPEASAKHKEKKRATAVSSKAPNLETLGRIATKNEGSGAKRKAP